MSRRIFETHSEYFIKKILEVDNVYNKLAYDDSPSLENFKPDGAWFILVDGSDIAGFINLKQLNNVLWSPHIVIFEQYRGSGSEEWGKQVAQYMKDKYGAKKFLAFTPYEAAKNYAERMGFKLIDTLSRSIQKNNELLDQYMLEYEA